MKTILPIVIIAILFAACSSNPYRPQNTSTGISEPSMDTAGLAQFQLWKAQEAVQEKIDAEKNQVAVIAAPKKKPVRRSSAATKSENPVTYETRTSESENAAKTVEKKGWSKAAKGAVIGAGSGAVLGAVINKRNRVVGGVIGGVVGAGAGYGIGRHMDKKDGRY